MPLFLSTLLVGMMDIATAAGSTYPSWWADHSCTKKAVNFFFTLFRHSTVAVVIYSENIERALKLAYLFILWETRHSVTISDTTLHL
jgi:hypothetical protein